MPVSRLRLNRRALGERNRPGRLRPRFVAAAPRQCEWGQPATPPRAATRFYLIISSYDNINILITKVSAPSCAVHLMAKKSESISPQTQARIISILGLCGLWTAVGWYYVFVWDTEIRCISALLRTSTQVPLPVSHAYMQVFHLPAVHAKASY